MPLWWFLQNMYFAFFWQAVWYQKYIFHGIGLASAACMCVWGWIISGLTCWLNNKYSTPHTRNWHGPAQNTTAQHSHSHLSGLFTNTAPFLCPNFALLWDPQLLTLIWKLHTVFTEIFFQFLNGIKNNSTILFNSFCLKWKWRRLHNLRTSIES